MKLGYDSHNLNIRRAKDSLEGLSVGDAFGEAMFAEDLLGSFPPGEWSYTDDTVMACSIVWCLREHGEIVQDELACHFALHYSAGRGYGNAMHELLEAIRAGGDWWIHASGLFAGKGSMGNGAAMRVAPLGAYFANDIEMCVRQAKLSAEITHTHKEAIAGAVAVAVATAISCSNPKDNRTSAINEILRYIPDNTVVSRLLLEAREMDDSATPLQAAERLGIGARSLAQDTVPFCIWVAFQFAHNYEAAIRAAVSVGGDLDTNCAIVGGIVAARLGRKSIPFKLLRHREMLPYWVFED